MKKKNKKRTAVGCSMDRMVRLRLKLWRGTSGSLDEVRSDGSLTQVVRGPGYCSPGSVACELRDTGNGYIALFPAGNSFEQDKYVCLDYDEARSLALALSPHARQLGFDA